ncbi:MAG TPA: YraN family protein [Candidatus Limnocylindrales bacterium]
MDAQPADRNRTQAQLVGDAAEALVVDRLAAAGWAVLARNVHVGRHELDLVAVDPGPPRQLVVVEVRSRGSREYGTGEETVDHRKRRRVRTATWALIQLRRLPDGTPLPELPVRFDLVVVEPGEPGNPGRHAAFRHHRAAF